MRLAQLTVAVTAALSLAACGKSPAPAAQAAPVDAQVAAAISDARAAAIDPATNRPRDVHGAFVTGDAQPGAATPASVVQAAGDMTTGTFDAPAGEPSL